MLRKNRYKTAVGLSYHPGKESAPTVEVKGENLSADRIVLAARRFGVPVVEDNGLAAALSSVELDQQIPESLFEAVAVVLNRVEAATGR